MGTNYYIGDLTVDDDEDDPKFHIGKVCTLHEGRLHFVWAQRMTKALKARIAEKGVLDDCGRRYNEAEFRDVLNDCHTSDFNSAGKKFC